MSLAAINLPKSSLDNLLSSFVDRQGKASARSSVECEQREDMRPVAEDLDAYKGIYEATDQIAGLYRPMKEEQYEGADLIELHRIWAGHMGNGWEGLSNFGKCHSAKKLF